MDQTINITKKINKYLSIDQLQNAIIILYGILSFIGVLCHEPWRDEAQAWLIARDLPLTGILSQMGYEGTPCLWHLILAPLTKSGLPYVSINLINWAVMVMAVVIFVKKSPFGNTTKFFIVLSYYIFFEYALIARSYGLSVLLLFSIASLYSRRFEKPYLFTLLSVLLINTNVHSIPISLSIMFVFILEMVIKNIKSRKIISLRVVICSFTILAGLLCVYLQLYQGRGKSITDGLRFSKINIHDSVISTVINYSKGFFTQTFYFLPEKFYYAFAVLLGLLLILLFIQKWQSAIIFLLSNAGLSVIFVYFYSASLRHAGFYYLTAITVLWIYNSYEKLYPVKPKYNFACILKMSLLFVLNIIIIYQAFVGVFFYTKEITSPFSCSKELSSFLKHNNLDDKLIVGYPASYVSSVLPYLSNKKIWDPFCERYCSYVTWDEKLFNSKGKVSLLINKIETSFSKQQRQDMILIVLKSVCFNSEDADKLQLIYSTSRPTYNNSSEEFSVYKFK